MTYVASDKNIAYLCTTSQCIRYTIVNQQLTGLACTNVVVMVGCRDPPVRWKAAFTSTSWPERSSILNRFCEAIQGSEWIAWPSLNSHWLQDFNQWGNSDPTCTFCCCEVTSQERPMALGSFLSSQVPYGDKNYAWGQLPQHPGPISPKRTQRCPVTSHMCLINAHLKRNLLLM